VVSQKGPPEGNVGPNKGKVGDRGFSCLKCLVFPQEESNMQTGVGKSPHPKGGGSVNRIERIKQAFHPRIPEPCPCRESDMIVRSYLGVVMDQMRQGYVETQCSRCTRVHRFAVNDCFTVGHRIRIVAN
jgi:hypothetical protein